MTRITVRIADDEEAPRAQLRAALQAAWPGLEIVAECHNGVDAWDAWLEHEPDLCLLDIRMPGLTGIDVARRIGGRTPLKELLSQLDERQFWQVHRSVIVNRLHVASAVRMDEGHMHLTLRGRRETLPVSRHFQGVFKGQ